ncbi:MULTISPECIES: nitrate- and nitrite sensing domain-containing protein [unclassified Streptomyces]|uniref:nitrate- and nitrite sensing domain-containing protein n=1 Tax=unclassified Streptomyces TaxID=2593676 RepID=UPI0022562AE1|nr:MULTISPECIES: nitrate- and nitrite sensing domain-containing protein [unclassified Streptomyces]MCX4789626.1 nitrate- and nitrite sensing domain-containing protein [Streptomyces sp. NBC_01221]WSP62433.1 nitrate- and nitrite sensing domain-containing protein [Streptomyces sp. NBC_01240]
MQGRFKRDGSAAAEQEPRGGTDRGSSPQHAQNPGPASAGDSGDRDRGPGVTAAAGTDPISSLKPRGPVSTGSRVALRNWRISTRLVSLLALPVVAATSLGGLRINDSMNDIQQLDHMQLLTKMTKQATTLAQALQEERDRSAGPLSNGVKPDDFKVTEPRKKSDRAKTAFLEATNAIGDPSGDEALEGIYSSVQQIASQLTEIRNIRKTAYAKDTPSLQTVDQYSQLITSLLSLSQDMAQATSNAEMIKRTRALAAFSSAKEYASVQRAIIAAALPGGNDKQPHLEDNDKQFGRAALRKEATALRSFKAVYGANAEELTATLDEGNPEIKAANTYAQKVLDSPSGMTGTTRRSYMDWYDQSSTKIGAMKTIEETLLSDMEGKARELRDQSKSEAIISGALILLVLGVSLVGAFVVARSMIRSLRRLQDTATRVAQDRLPELVKQLSEADPQDVDTSVESVGVHSRDEIGQVAAAFDDVHREAVRLAAEQALLRGNVNAMFTNLSRRSQGLIQRQLSLISELESREADPDQLSSLFKLDHLATRMRRNGENLLVLAGEEPGRRWTRPVPLVDVLRAAASEVEQYERIELAAVPATEVAGRVVNDLVHLLAELLENATSFSSPQTKVRVTGHALPDGRVLVEIHDTGIGLSPEDLAAINERLASPPTVDVSVSRRMGLFVVGRLSLRHGIRIQLRPSDSGGTTALVMLPVDVAHGGKQSAPKQGPGQQSAPGGLLGGAGGPGQGNAARPGLGGAPAAPAGRLAAGPDAARGQVGAGPGPRAALPSRDGGSRRPQDQQGQPGQPGRPGRQNAGFQSNGPADAGPQGNPRQEPQRQGGGLAGAFGNGARLGARGQGDGTGRTDSVRADVFGPNRQDQNRQDWNDQSHNDQNRNGRSRNDQDRFDQDRFDQQEQANGPAPWGAPQPQQARQNPAGQGGFPRSGGPVEPGRQLPPVGGPRAELPGGNPRPQRSQTTSWGADEPSAPRHTPLDAPRGHEEPESTGRFQRPMSPPLVPRPAMNDRQGPGSTAEFARPDFSGPAPQAPSPLDPASTAQFARPDFGQPQPGQDQGLPAPRQRDRDNEDFGAPRPPAAPHGDGQYRPVLPPQPQPEALPPAGPGDGRTPLYDTLETNWFHGPQQGGQQPPAEPQAPTSAPHQPGQELPAPAPRRAGADNGGTTPTWRPSPNDELVRQAERVKKPAAGGVTTSGLPRRVPRANLVPGTAQQQNHQSGPQVSRSPDDVRGRLTNLRRGIQQGRQANNGQSTGSFPLGPTHQQER